jgi:hypothetical protein
MSAPVLEPLDRIDRFLALGRDLAALPVMKEDRYVSAASDLHEIAKKLSVANENMARWLNRFLYFDFRADDARARFLKLAERYRNAKTSDEFKALKFSCGEIDRIYGRHIKGSLKNWLGRPAKDEANIFVELSQADPVMVEFLDRQFAEAIDSFLREVEPLVNSGDLDRAEAARLRFKVRCADLSARLERFSTGLSDLVIEFARLADEPVTR